MTIINNKVLSKPGQLIWQGIGLVPQFGKVMGSIPGQFFCWLAVQKPDQRSDGLAEEQLMADAQSPSQMSNGPYPHEG